MVASSVRFYDLLRFGFLVFPTYFQVPRFLLRN